MALKILILMPQNLKYKKDLAEVELSKKTSWVSTTKAGQPH
jgi:hypothetical protein